MMPSLKAALISATMMLAAAGTAHPAAPPAPQPELLEPEKAFRISTRVLDARNVEILFEIAEGYYMYRDRFRFETADGRVLADVVLPKGTIKDDPFFGRTEIYRREIRMRVPLSDEQRAARRLELKVISQGCADVGVCYLPLEQTIEARLGGAVPHSAPAATGKPRWRREDAAPMPFRAPARTPQGGSR